MSCVNVQYIDGDECIGASLPKINGNFAALSAAVCQLSANVPSIPDASINVFDSPTIDLNWNASTRTLSATTTSIVATSSSPMVAKAWVNFNGTGTIAIRDSYRISSITDLGGGRYQINVTFNTTNSSIIATCKYDIIRTTDPYDANVLLFNRNSDGTTLPTTSIGLSVTSDPGGTGTVFVDPLAVCVTIFSN